MLNRGQVHINLLCAARSRLFLALALSPVQQTQLCEKATLNIYAMTALNEQLCHNSAAWVQRCEGILNGGKEI